MAVQADWAEKDLYQVLGVAQDADAKTVKRAYRKLARDLHPDTHPDDAEAAELFKAVTAAYDVIGDETRRTEYDEFRRAMAGAGSGTGAAGAGRGFGGGFSPPGGDGRWIRFDGGSTGGDGAEWADFDTSTWTTMGGDGVDGLLGNLFGGRGGRGTGTAPRRGADLEAVLDLAFEDAVRGVTTEVTLQGPDGSKSFKVRVPAGVDDGQRIRLASKGAPGANGGPSGDLYAVVRVAPHPVFGRRGQDLTVETTVSWPQAVLGGEVDVPTFDGPAVRVRVPAGTAPGRILRVRGRGVRRASATGDLLVSVRLTVPDHVTDEQREAVEAVARVFPAAA